jgi:uncharacterized membrane protein YvlD (DUF360 family)
MALNDDCKYTLVWIIPLVILVLGFTLIICAYCYSINRKFIENGYHQEQKVGNEGVIWKK